MAQFMPARLNVNSLFGTYNVAGDTGNITLHPNNDDPMADFILRGKDGLQKKILHSDRTITALNDPITFLRRKREDLNAIALSISNQFAIIYSNELKRGLSHEQTKKNTVEEVDRRLDKLLKNHKEDFPDELTKRIIRKLTG